MINLPKWRLTNPSPAFYDMEGGTALEMTAKLYGAMNELIDEYNAFVQEMETRINNFESTTTEDLELFKTGLRQEFQDFIDTIDMRLTKLESDIAGESANLLNSLITQGKITVTPVYDDVTESLNYAFTVNGEV